METQIPRPFFVKVAFLHAERLKPNRYPPISNQVIHPAFDRESLQDGITPRVDPLVLQLEVPEPDYRSRPSSPARLPLEWILLLQDCVLSILDVLKLHS